jgi:hypothetical protein
LTLPRAKLDQPLRTLDHVGGSRLVRGLAAAASAGLAGVHLDRVVVASREATYLGVLFLVAGVGFGWVAWKLLRSDDLNNWLAGAALAFAVAAGYLLSCTIGLPGLPTEHWSQLGDTSTTLAVVVLALAAIRSRSADAETP